MPHLSFPKQTDDADDDRAEPDQTQAADDDAMGHQLESFRQRIVSARVMEVVRVRHRAHTVDKADATQGHEHERVPEQPKHDGRRARVRGPDDALDRDKPRRVRRRARGPWGFDMTPR